MDQIPPTFAQNRSSKNKKKTRGEKRKKREMNENDDENYQTRPREH